MKSSEIREMSLEEMKRKESDFQQELFNLHFQHEIGQLENPKRLKHIRCDIARINTIINEVKSRSQAEEKK